ncbi:unnamed protein product, partial [marine sediment metagenome]
RFKDGLSGTCKKCIKKYTTKWHQDNKDNKDNMKEYQKKYLKQYRQDNKDIIKDYKKQYRKENRDKIQLYQNNKRKKDIKYKTNAILSSSLGNALKSKGLSKRRRHWEDLVGWTVEEYWSHMEKLFRKKIVNGKEIVMTRDNQGYGECCWQMDHIYPNAKCGDTEEDVIYNWRLENLQPLWAKDNKIKHDSLDWIRDENKYLKI